MPDLPPDPNVLVSNLRETIRKDPLNWAATAGGEAAPVPAENRAGGAKKAGPGCGLGGEGPYSPLLFSSPVLISYSPRRQDSL